MLSYIIPDVKNHHWSESGVSLCSVKYCGGVIISISGGESRCCFDHELFIMGFKNNLRVSVRKSKIGVVFHALSINKA